MLSVVLSITNYVIRHWQWTEKSISADGPLSQPSPPDPRSRQRRRLLKSHNSGPLTHWLIYCNVRLSTSTYWLYIGLYHNNAIHNRTHHWFTRFWYLLRPSVSALLVYTWNVLTHTLPHCWQNSDCLKTKTDIRT